MEIVTDARGEKPAPEPEAPTPDAVMIQLLVAINENLQQQNQLLEQIFWATGGPQAAGMHQQMFQAFQEKQKAAIAQLKKNQEAAKIAVAAANAVPDIRGGQA